MWEVSAVERAISVLVGYAFGGVVVLPFDRLKTLMQVAANEGRSVGSMSLARQILRSQGVRGFYQGGYPHMLIAPYTMLYYSMYDEMLTLGGNGPLVPLGAAVVARAVEVIMRMPLELVRTQMQAAEGTVSLTQCVRAQLTQPPSSWLRGTVPTLLRDVPFSAIYWFMYEHTKRNLKLPKDWMPNPGVQTFVTGFSSGALAGMVAALATTPTDVIKTVRQQHFEGSKSPSYASILRYLVKEPRHAFAGVGPRLVRIPLGLSTMMSGLEATKWLFHQRRLQEEPPTSLECGSGCT